MHTISKTAFYLVLQVFVYSGFSQVEGPINWWDPAAHNFPVIEGQAWTGETEGPYHRLPARAKGNVREAVWGLSKNSAGLVVRFYSDAEEIIVRYQVSRENYSMPHMPATGVSGVDLYAKGPHGEWTWAAGRFSFKDTISYRFSGLRPNDAQHKMGREYRLYLPLYAETKWLHIGVKGKAMITPIPVRKEKPVVVYGTSIAQGGCASRPGNAWTAILGRALDRPLINLAFSGNGRLEDDVLELVGEIDAKVFVLDCLPNMLPSRFSHEELRGRIISAVRYLKEKRPDTPIVLAEHAGYTDGGINDGRKGSFTGVNEVLGKVFEELKKEGVSGLWLAPTEGFGQDINTTVDGTHQNDLGMLLYAQGYEKVMREVLNEQVGNITTTVPVTQRREPYNYEWELRHQEILAAMNEKEISTVLIGNSILHFWGGSPEAKIVNGGNSWKKYMDGPEVLNMAFGWDRIENVLWRIYHDALDGQEVQKIFLMIGTNNMHLNSDDEIIGGLQMLLSAIKLRQPKAEIIVSGIFPRRGEEDRLVALNQRIEKEVAVQISGARYVNPGMVLLGKDGKIDESAFSDGLHPNEKGYKRLGEVLNSEL